MVSIKSLWKNFLASKTLKVGLLQVIAGILLACADQLSTGGVLTISGVLTIVLRIVTTTKLNWD